MHRLGRNIFFHLLVFICFNFTHGFHSNIIKDIVRRLESVERSNVVLRQNDINLRQIIRHQQKDIQILQFALHQSTNAEPIAKFVDHQSKVVNDLLRNDLVVNNSRINNEEGNSIRQDEKLLDNFRKNEVARTSLRQEENGENSHIRDKIAVDNFRQNDVGVDNLRQDKIAVDNLRQEDIGLDSFRQDKIAVDNLRQKVKGVNSSPQDKIGVANLRQEDSVVDRPLQDEKAVDNLRQKVKGVDSLRQDKIAVDDVRQVIIKDKSVINLSQNSTSNGIESTTNRRNEVKTGLLSTQTDITQDITTQREQGLRQMFRSAQVNSEYVAFHATIDRGTVSHLSSGQTIVFDNVIFNKGNNYHSNGGIFITSKSGLYIFSVTILSYDILIANLESNGVRVASVYCHGHGGTEAEQASVTVIMDLKVGDEVFVKVDERGGQGEFSLYGDKFTSFTGVLLKEV